MIVFPAIDLKDGKVVRLYKGDFATVHQVADDPVETARQFLDAGCTHLHMVDLDGARDGQRKNGRIVREVCRTGLKVELGGGIRTPEDAQAVFDMGVERCVIGSAAVANPALVEELLKQWGPERVAVGIDAKDGLVRTAGWEENSGLDALDFARQMEKLGVQYIIFTDIDTDGTLSGPSYGPLAQLQRAVGCHITASGGVSCNEDLRRLREMGLYGAIVGKAWYAGKIDLKLAVKEAGEQ